jgi:hypothetical protein
MSAQAASTSAAAAMVRRFRAGVQSHQESVQVVTATPGAAGTPVNIDIPSYGFLRGLWLRLTVTGGVGSGTAAVYKEDAPWSWIQSFQLNDANSSPIIFQITGFDMKLIYKWGGYFASADPAQAEEYTQGGIGGNSVFTLYIPLELRARDGVGSMANQSANTAYKILMTIAPTTDVFSTAPAPTLPTLVRVQIWQDAWWNPQPTDLLGRRQAQTPPAPETVAYWAKANWSHAASGSITDRLTRLGQLYRNFVFTCRTTTPARSSTIFPDPFIFIYEGQQLTIQDRLLWRHMMGRHYGYTAAAETAGGIETGVYVMPFNRDFGLAPGAELGNGYLASTPASRVEFQGTLTAAGSIDCLVNDVAVSDQLAITG